MSVRENGIYIYVHYGNSAIHDGIGAGWPSVSNGWVTGLAANVLMREGNE